MTAAKPESLAVGNKMYDAEKELARLTKRYSLTADQKTKIQPILLEQQQQVHALGEDDALSDTEWAGAVRKVHTQTVAKVKLELTDAQATKYAKDEAKRAKSNGDSDNGDDGPPDGRGWEKMFERIELEQVTWPKWIGCSRQDELYRRSFDSAALRSG